MATSRREGPWTFVTHKSSRTPMSKKGQRKAKRRASTNTVPVIKGVAASKCDYPALCKKTKTAINEMRTSQLSFELINHLQHCVLTQKENFESYLSMLSSQGSNASNASNASNPMNSNNSAEDETVSYDPINVSIICYGLGNFSKTFASMQQLALLVVLRDFINSYETYQKHQKLETTLNSQETDQKTGDAGTEANDGDDAKMSGAEANNGMQRHVFSWEKNAEKKNGWKEKKNLFEKFPFRLKSIEFYEPVLTKVERNILKNLLRINVLDGNTQGFYELGAGRASGGDRMKYNEILICYMPHCPKLLYNNILYSNWDKLQLSKLFVIGNSFAQYSGLAKCVSKSERWNMNYILACNELGICVEDALNQWLPGQEHYQTQPSGAGSGILFEGANKQNHKHTWGQTSSDAAGSSGNKGNNWSKHGNKKRKRQRRKFNSNRTRDTTLRDPEGNRLDQHTVRQLGLTGQAFAFQNFEYFSIREIIRCDEQVWQQTAKMLKDEFEKGMKMHEEEELEKIAQVQALAMAEEMHAASGELGVESGNEGDSQDDDQMAGMEDMDDDDPFSGVNDLNAIVREQERHDRHDRHDRDIELN